MQTARVNPVEIIRYQEQQKEWRWQVAVYLFLAGIGAGSLVLGILADWLGLSPHPLRAALLWGPILVAFGALFLILKLGIKRRFLNTVLNPRTSWLSRGFYILSACIIVGALVFGISLLPFLQVDIGSLSTAMLVLQTIGLILALATAVYTGILIQSVKYVPLWNTPLLPVLFTVSSLSTGSMALILSALLYTVLAPAAEYPSQLLGALILTERVLIVVEGVVLAVFLLSRYRAEQEGKTSVKLLLSGGLKFVFWIGVVVSGFLFPIVLEAAHSRFHQYHSLLFLAGAFLLTGGFFLRIAVIYAGVKNRHPMQRLVELKHHVSSLPRRQGQPG